MKLSIVSGTAAVALALSTAAAFAQTQAAPRNPGWTNDYDPTIKPPKSGPYNNGAGSVRTSPEGVAGQYVQSDHTTTQKSSKQ